ncbi:HAD family hydrolase [Crocosphaera sp.]|uniref:HAD family hydrolase n=1 Tax=Crocosphaera sp. TaxID=2729996 RepID=UPI003F26010F
MMNFKPIYRKNCLFFLSLLVAFFCLGGTVGCLPAYAALDSWNETSTKQEIMDFVNKVIDDEIPVKDRIAVFDNDGTLWAERPHYFQEDFIKNRLPDVPTNKVSKLLKMTQKEIDKTGGHPISEEGKISLSEIPITLGLTTDEYDTLARSFLDNIHSDMASEDDGDFQRFDTEYINLTYKPVIELVNYLKENDFKVYICSGGGIYFVRSFSDEAYGIPTEEVIGSAIKTVYDDSNNTVVRQLGLAHYDDQEGKPVGIELFIGKRPLVAVGNSGGDFEMFKYTDSGVGNSLIVLINHDDCEREYEYNNVPGETDPITQEPLNESLDYAQTHANWIVASMKDDFKTIFESNPSRTPPMCN